MMRWHSLQIIDWLVGWLVGLVGLFESILLTAYVSFY